ncbi:uncharacterized protein BDR25DRAFT_349484 [Lindgomyces ingoldianus]|uniref:Uncharacterized protein n=1 Tax=Lindgomyces ingoldianus TaxID=673940 RepID=A0ACB6RCX0_9PLEO|nr:uncharacterized protein BDR25DRAFT_349484 [Lindgomyces ingoldianus]KAF2476367.1 hypothetical protein BDR25DRAFT_349484 [Lindgomyces ingoldianus]
MVFFCASCGHFCVIACISAQAYLLTPFSFLSRNRIDACVVLVNSIKPNLNRPRQAPSDYTIIYSKTFTVYRHLCDHTQTYTQTFGKFLMGALGLARSSQLGPRGRSHNWQKELGLRKSNELCLAEQKADLDARYKTANYGRKHRDRSYIHSATYSEMILSLWVPHRRHTWVSSYDKVRRLHSCAAKGPTCHLFSIKALLVRNLGGRVYSVLSTLDIELILSFALHVSTIEGVSGGIRSDYLGTGYNFYNILFLQDMGGDRYQRVGVGTVFDKDIFVRPAFYGIYLCEFLELNVSLLYDISLDHKRVSDDYWIERQLVMLPERR